MVNGCSLGENTWGFLFTNLLFNQIFTEMVDFPGSLIQLIKLCYLSRPCVYIIQAGIRSY